MLARIWLWLHAYFFAWVLVIVASLIMRRRMSHNRGIVGAGTLRVVDNPAFPAHDFFTPGHQFRCRLRHAPVSYDDDAIIQVRAASLKFADTTYESPLDVEMNTGRISLFWTAHQFLREFVPARDFDPVKKIQYARYYAKYPRGLVAAKDGIRKHPETFAHMHYHSQTAQRFLAKDGVERYVKFRLIPFEDVPETGLLSPEEQQELFTEVVLPGETRGPTYLKDEYRERVAREPVKYRLQLQLHTKTDNDDPEILNCNVDWDPETHPYMDVAVVEIDQVLSHQEESRMIFSITHCPPALGLLESTSIHDYTSISYLRAKSDIAKRARLFAYRLFGAPKPQPRARRREAPQ